MFALSDLHVNYPENRAWLAGLSDADFRGDALLVAGDVSEDLNALGGVLGALRRKFAAVCFVPGNHDLWVRPKQRLDSRAKLDRVLARCAALGVHTAPLRFGPPPGVWLVPLFSWYETEGPDSLFLPRPGRDLTLAVWSDRTFVRWPAAAGPIAGTLLARNAPHLGPYDAPVVSFSHFLPRVELIPPDAAERARARGARRAAFNFSRVAGSRRLERQLRRLGSAVHVYGHQHRNRARTLDGLRYVSYGLGYPQERALGQLRLAAAGPQQVWPVPK